MLAIPIYKTICLGLGCPNFDRPPRRKLPFGGFFHEKKEDAEAPSLLLSEHFFSPLKTTIFFPTLLAISHTMYFLFLPLKSP